MHPQILRHRQTTHTLQALPNSQSGATRQTLYVMREITRYWRKHPRIRDLAKRIVRRCPEKHWPCQLARLHAWVRDRVKYMRDVRGVETVQTPDKTLADGSGDCDDKSVLLAALIESIGHPARFVAVGPHPGTFSHVLVEARLGPRWVPLETTEKWPMGRAPRGVKSRMFLKV